MEQMKTILSGDPGLRNFAYTVLKLRLRRGQLAFKILENGMSPHTITQMANSKELRREGEAFKRFFKGLVKTHGVDVLAAERYMSRGMGGITIEVVNMMIGWLCLHFTSMPQSVISAATWKNAVRRKGVDLDATYKLTKVTPHQLDSFLIGLFIGCIGFKQKDFGNLNLVKLMPSILLELERTSTTRLTKRKGLDR